MKMPNADRAVADIEKLRDYVLNPAHPRGRHKARVFASRLGLTADMAEALREALLAAARGRENAVAGEHDGFGRRFVIDFECRGPIGTAWVRSAWIVRTDEVFPRLTSCYVL